MPELPSYLKYVVDIAQQGDFSNITQFDSVILRERSELREKLTKDKFWFVSVPRTSSSSIQSRLGAHFGYPHGKQELHEKVPRQAVPRVQSMLLPQHTPAFIVRDILAAEIWDQCNSFAVVRHPYSWSLSMWRYVNIYGELGFGRVDFLTFLNKFKENIRPKRIHRTWFPSHYSQHDYLVEKQTNKFLVKIVLKFEKRDNIEEFLRSLGLPAALTEERMMASDSAAYKLNNDEKAAVRKVFEKDFDLLGY